MRVLAFDIETVRRFEAGECAGDLPMPLAVVCVATARATHVWHGMQDDAEGGALTAAQVCDIVDFLWNMSRTHTLVTWSGTRCDWPLLALNCRSFLHRQRCAHMAMFSIDMALSVLARKGFMASLASAACAMGLARPKPIDSCLVEDMWAAGRVEEVVELCRVDAVNTREIALAVARERELRWTTARGKAKAIAVPSGTFESAFVCAHTYAHLPPWRWELFSPRDAFQWMWTARICLPLWSAHSDPFHALPTFAEWRATMAPLAVAATTPPQPPQGAPAPTPSSMEVPFSPVVAAPCKRRHASVTAEPDGAGAAPQRLKSARRRIEVAAAAPAEAPAAAPVAAPAPSHTAPPAGAQGGRSSACRGADTSSATGRASARARRPDQLLYVPPQRRARCAAARPVARPPPPPTDTQ